jgi:cation-transporting ATPase 13A3/4/5
MVVTLLVASYMLFDPAQWLSKLMDLTYMDMGFKVFILVLAGGGFVVSYTAEKYLLPRLAWGIGHFKVWLRPQWRKKRKEYKVVLESMRG